MRYALIHLGMAFLCVFVFSIALPCAAVGFVYAAAKGGFEFGVWVYKNATQWYEDDMAVQRTKGADE